MGGQENNRLTTRGLGVGALAATGSRPVDLLKVRGEPVDQR
jgi:hypothetical protein